MSLIKKKNYNINYMHFVTRSLGTAVSIQTIKPFPALIYLLCCHNNFLFHRGCSICTTSITCPLQFHPGWLFSILHSTLWLSEKENKGFNVIWELGGDLLVLVSTTLGPVLNPRRSEIIGENFATGMIFLLCSSSNGVRELGN